MKNIIVQSNQTLLYNGKEYRCALGRGGIKKNKKEGDGATPEGSFLMRKLYYRPDVFKTSPETILPTQALSQNDGWSDDETLSEYNTFITLPYVGSHERLWRDDHPYDLIIPLGYNDDPPIPGKGSAIFMHIARKEYTFTNGCIALSQNDLLEICKTATTKTLVTINSPQQSKE